MPVDKPVSIFNPARFRLGEWLLMRQQAQSLGYAQYGADGWSAIEPAALPASSLFSRHVLLLPDHQCAFRNRSFPFELVSSSDIEEAVALDLEQWNPFQVPCGSLYFTQRHDNCWQVAVWVWP
ncbi:MAG: hypothetical protein Q9M30_10790, partial [Mariprofundaceae bacterium]|nr:hypothetical protein [Mariprofundaceae bacterium]